MIKSIILLSGGLDSLVSLAMTRNEYNVNLALTFDYGQKALNSEINKSRKICEYYKIQHKVIKLDWLKEITNTALVSDKDIPKINDEDLLFDEITKNSAKLVWVPNRNGLFVNIAAAYADSFGYDYIIIGANEEEAKTFPDNSEDFIFAQNEGLKYSTLVHPKVFAPLINLTKSDIVKKALEHCAPLELAHSCYEFDEGHCGVCESCVRLKKALEANDCNKIIEVLFNNAEL